MKSLLRLFTRYFFQGMLFILPISITVWVAYTIFRSVDLFGRKILGAWITESTVLTGIGFAVTLALITLVGYFSSIWFGAVVLDWIERQLIRSPGIRGVYKTIRDTVHAFLGEKKFFSQTVIVDFPKLGYQRVGFITQESFPGIGNDAMVVVYIPHSFQISGNMILVPKENVRPLDVPPEAVLKMIISGGMVKR